MILALSTAVTLGFALAAAFWSIARLRHVGPALALAHGATAAAFALALFSQLAERAGLSMLAGLVIVLGAAASLLFDRTAPLRWLAIVQLLCGMILANGYLWTGVAA